MLIHKGHHACKNGRIWLIVTLNHVICVEELAFIKIHLNCNRFIKEISTNRCLHACVVSTSKQRWPRVVVGHLTLLYLCPRVVERQHSLISFASGECSPSQISCKWGYYYSLVGPDACWWLAAMQSALKFVFWQSLRNKHNLPLTFCVGFQMDGSEKWSLVLLSVTKTVMKKLWWMYREKTHSMTGVHICTSFKGQKKLWFCSSLLNLRLHWVLELFRRISRHL